MSDEVITKAEILSLVVRVAALSAISYYTVKWLMDAMDPTRKQKLKAQEKAKQLMTDLGITANMKLNEYEMMIASNLVDGRSIGTSWKDIAGLEDIVEELVGQKAPYVNYQIKLVASL